MRVAAVRARQNQVPASPMVALVNVAMVAGLCDRAEKQGSAKGVV